MQSLRVTGVPKMPREQINFQNVPNRSKEVNFFQRYHGRNNQAESNGNNLFFGPKVPPLSLSSQWHKDPWSFNIKNNYKFRNKSCPPLLRQNKSWMKKDRWMNEESCLRGRWKYVSYLQSSVSNMLFH